MFSEESLETYIAYKRKNESDAVRLRPHPYEFAPYYDIQGSDTIARESSALHT